MPYAAPPRAPSLAGGLMPAVILVRPQLAENIGMCARAMANFALSDLRLVAPRDGWPQKARLKKGAYAASSGAHAILDRARLFDTVEAAVADLNRVWATTARERGQGKRVVAPRQAMAEAASAAAAGGRHGILFGPERTGLESDEIALADAIVTFPVDPGFPSLNLSQAVLLMGYEWFMAARDGELPFAEPVFSPPARRDSVIAFFRALEAELESAGHYRDTEKRALMRRNLRNFFHRGGMTEQDVRTLRGVLVSLVKGRRGAG
jgi:tRNA/rRNA methyltransferase